jgi:hypothetical protein
MKELNYDWAEIMLKLKEYHQRLYVENGGVVVKDGFAANSAGAANGQKQRGPVCG